MNNINSLSIKIIKIIKKLTLIIVSTGIELGKYNQEKITTAQRLTAIKKLVKFFVDNIEDNIFILLSFVFNDNLLNVL